MRHLSCLLSVTLLAVLLSSATANAQTPDAQAQPPTTLPQELSWFKPEAVTKALQGEWDWAGQILTIKGSKVTVQTPEGEVNEFTLTIQQPGRVSFLDADGNGERFAFAVKGKEVYLGNGTAGLVRKTLHVVADGWSGGGVVIFDAKTGACTAINESFGKWGKPEAITGCELRKEGDQTILSYAYPDLYERDAGREQLVKDTIVVRGDALLDEQLETTGKLVRHQRKKAAGR